MKSTATISLDTEILIASKQSKVNLSGLINTFLKDYFELKEEVLEERYAEEQINTLKLKKIHLESQIEAIKKDEEKKKRDDAKKYKKIVSW